MKILICLTLAASSLFAQTPVITGIVNPGSDLPPGTPNYGIAQGSVFIIYGKTGPGLALSNTGLVQAATPLPSTLNGATLSVSAGGTSIPVPMIYASPGQIAAIMPSTAPFGTASVNLSVNGGTGISFQTTVTRSTFGISTADGSGNGQAAVTFGDYTFVTPTNAAAPGDTLIVWGTGLGALPAGTSDGQPNPFGNIPATIQVLIGGVPATSVQYAGRAPGAVGLDQINFTVPANAPVGCQISIMVQTTSPTVTVSNGPTLAIAGTHHTTCTDPVQTFPQSAMSGLLSKSGVKAVAVQAKLGTSYNLPQGGGAPVATTDGSASTYFLNFSQAQITAQASTFNTTSSLNSCFTLVAPSSNSDGNGPNASLLDAGSSVVWHPASGPSVTLTAQQPGNYSASLTSLNGGTYQLTAAGGADIPGTFSFNFPVPQPITWSNMNALLNSTVDRTKPLTISWTGGDANGYVEIMGQSQIGPQNGPNYTLAFDCTAPSSALSFTIPSAVLQMMPASYANIEVSTSAYPASIGAVSLFDVAINLTRFQTSIPVIFK